MLERRRGRIADRENDYQRRRTKIRLSPDRMDPFADGKENVYRKFSDWIRI